LSCSSSVVRAEVDAVRAFWRRCAAALWRRRDAILVLIAACAVRTVVRRKTWWRKEGQEV